VSGARYYDVRVVTEAGDVVAEQRLTGTEWHPGSRAALRPDLEYFVRVDAYVSEGNAIGSEHVSFRVAE
jgi:ribosomal protein L27